MDYSRRNLDAGGLTMIKFNYSSNATPMDQASPFSTSGVSWQHLRDWRMGINGIGNVGGEVVHRWGGFAKSTS